MADHIISAFPTTFPATPGAVALKPADLTSRGGTERIVLTVD